MTNDSSPDAMNKALLASISQDPFSEHLDSIASRLRGQCLESVLKGLTGGNHRSTARPARGPRRLLKKRNGTLYCLFPTDWKAWDIGVGSAYDFRRVSDDERQRCEDTRNAIPVAHLGRIMRSWHVAPDSGTGAEALDHIHVEGSVDGHTVHVDRFHRERSRPGRSLIEIRIFVDGVLAGRAGMCGCSLGGGGNDLPAIARVGPSRAVTVDIVSGVGFPVVELWEVAPASTHP